MRIEDYALIGDLRTTALVSKEGSIDWLCLPRFDSGACFASLLGKPENGFWQLQPRSFTSVQRRYRDDSLVLETRFDSPEGQVLLIDTMLPESSAPSVVRIVKGIRGTVRMSMELVIRFDYGSLVPWVTRGPFGGIKAVAGPDTLRLKTTAPLYGKNMRTYSDFDVHEGQSLPFVLQWAPSEAPAPPEIEDPEHAIERTYLGWQDWMSHCRYHGPHREAVHRSLITLKSLIYDPTGGIIAAPTTSLPECPGGVRNWDYRFCWIRDSTLTLFALLNAGYREEALRWRDWLLRAVAGTPSDIRIMFGLDGTRRLTEFELPWLQGYECSRPVRIGNAAHDQRQLDIFGHLMDTFHLSQLAGLEPDQSAWRVQRKILDHVVATWQLPDRGIWEVRGGDQQFTHSKVMAWVALDRAVKELEGGRSDGDPRCWADLAHRIHADVCENGFNHKVGAFTQVYGSENLDASALMMPSVGFLPARDPRVLSTVAAIEKALMKQGFVYRYKTGETQDGLPGSEGAFLPCTLWLADNYFLQGEVARARQIFEQVLSVRNDVGLLAEEYDPDSKRLVGNYPQAFSHISLLRTAFLLASGKHTTGHSRTTMAEWIPTR